MNSMRQPIRWWRFIVFEPLLNFANREITTQNWQKALHEAMGEERIFEVNYKVRGSWRKKRALWKFVKSNLLEEFWGRPFFGIRNSKEREKAKDIFDIVGDILESAKAVLPPISGKKANLQRTLKLQNKIRGILFRIANCSPCDPRQKAMLTDHIRGINGSYPKRTAIIFPNGDVHYKSQTANEGEDAESVLLFQAAYLLHEVSISDEKIEQAKMMVFPWDLREHPLESRESAVPDFPLKLRSCHCGCSQFYLQEGKKEKLFIEDKHRKNFHNRKRTENGMGAKYQRAYRDKNPELKMDRK